MAMLAREALKNETFRDICSSEKIRISFGNTPYERWLTNTNKLLSMYDGVYGVKTGFTDEAGRCLVSACERDGKKLICVTLNDRNDWNDHIAMYEYGFQNVKCIKPELPQQFELDIVGADENKITLKPDLTSFGITTSMDDLSGFSYSMISAPFVYAPIYAGDQTAELKITYNGREVCRVPLIAENDYNMSETREKKDANKNFFKKIAEKFMNFFK